MGELIAFFGGGTLLPLEDDGDVKSLLRFFKNEGKGVRDLQDLDCVIRFGTSGKVLVVSPSVRALPLVLEDRVGTEHLSHNRSTSRLRSSSQSTGHCMDTTLPFPAGADHRAHKINCLILTTCWMPVLAAWRPAMLYCIERKQLITVASKDKLEYTNANLCTQGEVHISAFQVSLRRSLEVMHRLRKQGKRRVLFI